MKNMTLSNIAIAANGQYFGNDTDKNIKITGVSIDSRDIEKGYLFVPVKGERVDGHDFILKAFDSGAVCTLSERLLDKRFEPYILVESTLQAIKDIAEFYRSSINIKLVAITGSVGKTTTKEMVAAVLEQKYNVLKTAGNFNNEIGMPLTILKIRDKHEIAVVEMGISDFDEMHRLSKIAKPDICIITNIGDCHLENLKSREGVLKAKTEIFDYIQKNGSVILNGDDELLSGVEKVNDISPIFFGIFNKNNIYAENIKRQGIKGIKFDIIFDEKKIEVNLPVPGNHMIYNSLAAVAAARELGLDNDQIVKGIESFETVSGRARIIKTEFLTIIDDCYNANPMSMKAAIDTLADVQSRKVCILGDMLELGENTEKFHNEIGKYAVIKSIDLILCIGEHSKYMYEGAKGVLNKSIKLYFETKEELIVNMPDLIKLNDTILIKASRGMHFEVLVNELEDYIIK